MSNQPKYGFLTDLDVRRINGIRWAVLSPLEFRALNGKFYRVPIGFVTDFASSRFGRWNFLPPQFAYSASSVLHDWGYEIGLETKATYDLLFKEALEDEGAGSIVQAKAYWGVRVFGGSAWQGHRLNPVWAIDEASKQPYVIADGKPF